MYVCLWSPAWSIGGASDAEGKEGEGGERGAADLAPLLASLVPRIRVEREVLWADGRGLDPRRLAERLVERVATLGIPVRAGVAAVPVTAEVAARWGHLSRESGGPTPFLVKERTGWGWRRTSPHTSSSAPSASAPPPLSAGSRSGGEEAWGQVVEVPEGGERAWLAGLPVAVLESADRLRTLLEGVGVGTLGALAALEREAVEVRLGAAAVTLWRLARADDPRLLFDRIPPERPHGSLDFVDYVLTDASRLLFTANALLGPLCDGMAGRGEHARALRLTLPLANGEAWARTVRPARPTASRETWLRLIRELLDRLTVPDAVSGMCIEVGATEEAGVRQGDLFDQGFATAAAVEAAVARLAERQLHPLTPDSTAHPLVERRGSWSISRAGTRSGVPRDPGGSAGLSPGAGAGLSPGASASAGAGPGASVSASASASAAHGLGLQLLEEPRPIRVETTGRRDHEVPVRLWDRRDRRGWREVAVAAGPDRISGGQWEASSYAREYYRCVTDEGVPLWVYRDGVAGGWYLHGWWD